MERYVGIESGPRNFVPTVEEALAKGDEMLDALAGAELPTGLSLSEWYFAERDRRYAEFDARRRAPVDVEGGPLIVGEWYDVTVDTSYGYGRAARLRTWRICRYRGRAGSAVHFTRFGAKAATDPYMREKNDSIAIDKVIRVEKLEPDPRILAKLDERRRAEDDGADE